jgi:hypothetical protein
MAAWDAGTVYGEYEATRATYARPAHTIYNVAAVDVMPPLLRFMAMNRLNAVPWHQVLGLLPQVCGTPHAGLFNSGQASPTS